MFINDKVECCKGRFFDNTAERKSTDHNSRHLLGSTANQSDFFHRQSANQFAQSVKTRPQTLTDGRPPTVDSLIPQVTTGITKNTEVLK